MDEKREKELKNRIIETIGNMALFDKTSDIVDSQKQFIEDLVELNKISKETSQTSKSKELTS